MLLPRVDGPNSDRALVAVVNVGELERPLDPALRAKVERIARLVAQLVREDANGDRVPRAILPDRNADGRDVGGQLSSIDLADDFGRSGIRKVVRDRIGVRVPMDRVIR